MPTTRPRHSVTETEQVARALDAAARTWPEDKAARGQLLLRLVEAGHKAIADEHEQRQKRRQRAIRRTSGAFTAAYEPEYLTKLRNDWPE